LFILGGTADGLGTAQRRDDDLASRHRITPEVRGRMNEAVGAQGALLERKISTAVSPS
jgi:hypothetical protein